MQIPNSCEHTDSANGGWLRRLVRRIIVNPLSCVLEYIGKAMKLFRGHGQPNPKGSTLSAAELNQGNTAPATSLLCSECWRIEFQAASGLSAPRKSEASCAPQAPAAEAPKGLNVQNRSCVDTPNESSSATGGATTGEK